MTDTPNTQNPLPEPLSAIQLRVLGCLVEKQVTTPETYPLTLNALLLACNQKTSREPVMNLAAGEVGQALRQLEDLGLVSLVMGSRADRWEQRLEKRLELIKAQAVLLSLLFLRGAQTPGELLTRSSRWHDFDDAEQVLHHLDRLLARGFVQLLPKRPGQREDRYWHALGSEAPAEPVAEERVSGDAGLLLRIETLEQRLAAMEERLLHLESNR